MRRTVAAFTALLLAGCSTGSTDTAAPSQSYTPPAAGDRACKVMGDVYNESVQGWVDQVDFLVSQGIDRPTAEQRASTFHAPRLGANITAAAAGLWPDAETPDVKDVLRNIARGDDWFAEVTALQTLCGLSAPVQPIEPEWTDR
jgi:hypothetical protein